MREIINLKELGFTRDWTGFEWTHTLGGTPHVPEVVEVKLVVREHVTYIPFSEETGRCWNAEICGLDGTPWGVYRLIHDKELWEYLSVQNEQNEQNEQGKPAVNHTVRMQIRWNGLGGKVIVWSGDTRLAEASVEGLAIHYPERLDDLIKLYVRAKWGVDLDER